MGDEELDDALDELSPWDRAEVLRMFGEPEQIDDPAFGQMGCAVMLALLWGLPWAALGLVCVITVIGVPFGLLFWGIGSYPLYRLFKKWSVQGIVRK